MTGVNACYEANVSCYCLKCKRKASVDRLADAGGGVARKLSDRHEVALPDDAAGCEQCGGRRFVVRISIGT